MANENQVDFTVRVKNEGLSEVATDLKKVEDAAKDLGAAATAAGDGVEKLADAADQAGAGLDTLAGAEAKAEQESADLGARADTATDAVKDLGDASTGASKGVEDVGQSATKAGAELAVLARAVDDKTKAIKAGLQVEQSEIELQRQHLLASQAEEQARLQAAEAKGDDAAATRAGNALRQIESDQLALVARAKRAEATAVQEAADARRQELAAVGPLNAAHAKELQAAENYARALRVEAAAADQAAQRARELGTAKRGAANATDQLSGRVGNLTQLLGQMAGALGVAFTFRELVTAAAQMEQLRSGLTAITGDATKAGQELEFVRVVAARIGADVTEVGKAFLGLSAATKGTAVEGEPTRQVFEAVATAMGKAGKSSAETSLALQALSQMASKGVVQMEELRGQLGEQLPGALNATAKGLGITTADLIKLVEEGKIAASDLFPALAKGLNDLYGGAPSAQTLSQEITNIKNAFIEMAANIGEAGGLSALKTGAEIVQAGFVSLDATVVATGKSIGTVIAALVNRDFSGLKQAFADIQKEAQDKLLKAAQHNETLRAAIKGSGDEAAIAALAQQDLATKTAQAAAAAAAGANDFVKLQNGYSLVRDFIRDQIAEQEKSVIARNAEGTAAVALASAFGTETEQRQAQAAAAAASAVELEKLAKLKLTELATMQEELKSLKAESEQLAVIDAEKKKQMAELEKQVALRQQDVDKAVAQAGASRLVAEQSKVEAEALRDNSGRVVELREAYETARAKLEQVRAAKEAGLATTKELKNAELEAGRAATLYRDALQDQLQAIQAKANVQQSSISLEQAGVRLAIEQQRAIFEVARARGDERTAMQAQNEIRKLEIQLLELTAKAKRVEAQAALAVVAARRADLESRGLLTEATRLELDSAQMTAQVKVKEAEIAEVTAEKLKKLADAHDQVGNSANRASGQVDRLTGAMQRQSNAAGGPPKGAGGLSEGDPDTPESRELERKALEAEAAGQHLAAADFRRKADRERHIAEGQQKSRETRFVGMLQSDINQMIAQRYGEDMVGNAKAEEAWNRNLELENYQKSYGSVMRSQESLNQQRNIRAERDRLERELEEERAAKANANTPTDGNQAVQPSGTRASGASGPSYVSNITLTDGRKATVRYADSESLSTNERLLRELAEGKGVYQ